MSNQRKPHREICSLCHEVLRVGFHVPDEIWKLSVHVSQLNNIICLRCFARLADERGVAWDENIKFFPTRQLIEKPTITEEEIDELCVDIAFEEGYERNNTIKEWLEEHNIKVKK